VKTILHTVGIAASPDTVFDALATGEGLAGWWTATVTAEEEVGGVVDLRFGATFNPDMKVTELDRPRHVAWTCTGGHEPWRGNTFRFDIEPRGNGAILLFRQDYALELSDEEYGRYNFNWGYYFESHGGTRKQAADGHTTPPRKRTGKPLSRDSWKSTRTSRTQTSWKS